ncbi:MFS general substrate transporter [Mycena alexandri]|uniref:MFS general substrate transporter n=1 Tax=Mycena alexandri TaxID=1745969 RepID=A0AAD6TIY5_9AGAR|nr:MFS general substrate transporter [Mycena alexandri]
MSSEWETSSTVCGDSVDTHPSSESTQYDVEKATALSAPTHSYSGSGTKEDPYIVDFSEGDPENPLNFHNCKKWIITSQLAFATWTISFSSSVYSGGLEAMARDLHISDNVAILGLSLYVLGFALGPLIFAPMGEMYGRRLVFFITLASYTVFQLEGCLGGSNVYALLSCRLLTGIFGSSPLTNAPSQIADIWNARERGLASAIYSGMPFLGPIIGPVVGGYVVMKLDWHFNFWLMFIFSALSLLSGAIFTPETYAPVLLRRRAAKLAQESNGIVHYVSTHDLNRPKSISRLMLTNFSRPFVFLVTEPIVLCVALYISIVYGTLYALFAAFPIVFQQHHHFTSAQGGLAFTGIGVGIIIGLGSTPIQNRVYWRAMEKSETGRAAPEARLHQAMVGGVLIPIGLFWFAFTASPSVHWLVPIVGSAFFGTGIAQILQSLTSYLMDAYELYFASAVASTIVLRSVCAAFLPQVVPTMFERLGDEAAMSVFAVLGLVCTPIPFLFWRYGRWIRSKSSVAFKESSLDSPSQTTTRCETMSEKDVEHP